jgi:hypothetical protein
VVAVLTVMALVLGAASFAFAFDSGGSPSGPGANSITWTGQGATNGVLNTTQCDASNTPYLLWVLTTDGGSAHGAALHLSGTGSGDYAADVSSGNTFKFTTPYFTPDSNLHATADFTVDTVGNGSWNLVISHGCSGLKPLTATKTANGSYTNEYGWTIDKSVAPDSFSGNAGDPAFTSNYNVDVTQTITPKDFAVSGNITVNNPNSIPASFTASDVLNDGTGASVTCPTSTIPANDSVMCSYTASPKDASATLNTATVTSTTTGIGSPDPQPTASVNWAVTETGNKTVNVTDSVQGPLGQATGDPNPTSFQYAKDFVCPTDASQYENGKYTHEFPNTATIDETGQSANANVTVTCTLPALQVSKTAAGSYDHVISWNLDKSANPTSFSGNAGQTFTPQDLWTVNATKSAVDSNYQVTGQVTIANPAAIPQSFTVGDVLDNGSVVNVNCPTTTLQPSGTAGDSVICSYTASQTDASATLNTATVSAAGNADQQATDPVEWTANATGDNTVTLGDARFSYSQSISDTTQPPVQFDDSFSCPPNNSNLYVNDQYSFNVKNTATLKGDSTDLSKDATVTVNCVRTRVPGGLTMGYWQNKNGQDTIKNGPPTCPTAANQLRAYLPFQDLTANATCTQLQTYVTNVIKAANASGASMNALLKGQMLATTLDVIYGKVSGGGNVDLTAIPKPVTGSTYENTSAAFGSTPTCQSVSTLLTYAASQSNVGGTAWYGQVKATQELAKDTFDAINNAKAFTC